MAQFDGGKYKNGILSYNYLGEGEAGAGRGPVSIKKGKGGDWFFVDQNGKVRTDVGIEGKLTPTHIKNLENDGIFKSAKIDSQGKKLTKAQIEVGPDIESSKGDLPGASGGGVDLEKSNFRVATRGVPTADQAAVTTAPNLSSPSKGSIDYQKYTGGPVTASGYGNSGVPPEVPSETYTGPGTSIWSPGAGELSVRGSSTQGNMPMNYSSGGDRSQSSPSGTPTPTQYDNSGYTFPTGEGPGQMSLRPDRNRIAGDFESAGGVQKLNTQNTIENMKGPGGYSNFEVAASPYVDSSTKGLTIGKGGDPGLFEVDDDFYRTKDGTLMKDGGWFSGDTAATQADINAGIKNQASPGMTSAEGWQAAGSVMKGVGGLASAYTGIKNYQLARDAHNTQKNQWQANYDQQLKAFEQNKKLANQEIQERNRILKSRNPDRTDLYKEL
jgi:hypothetical protein